LRPRDSSHHVMILLSMILWFLAGLMACEDQAATSVKSDSIPSATPVPAHPGTEPSSPSLSGNIYASGADLQVTGDDWDRFLNLNPQYIYKTFLQRDEAEDFVRDRLLNILTDKYFFEQAREMGLLDDPQLSASMEMLIRTNLYKWFIEEKLPSLFMPTPEEIEEYYNKYIEHFRVPVRLAFRQIFLRFDGLDETEKAARRELAQDLVNKLREDPGQFSPLALKYSESSLEPRDDLLSNVDPDKLHRELRELLMQLDEGGISGPIESRDGLHIVVLEERTPEYMSLESATGSIKSNIFPSRMSEYLKVMTETADEEFDLLLPPIPDRLEPDTLIVGGAEEILGADAALAYGQSIEEMNDPNAISTIFHSFQGVSVALAIIRRDGWDKEMKYRQIMENMQKTLLWEKYQDRRIEASGGITDDMILEYYIDHAEEYTVKMRCQVRECRLMPSLLPRSEGGSVPVSEVYQKALEIRKAWEGGADFESLIRDEPMAARREQGGIVLWMDDHMDTPVVRFEDISHLEVGEVSQPKRLPKGYSLMQLIQREEDVLRPLDDIRNSIKVRVRQQLRDQYRAEFEEAVKRDLEWSVPDQVIDTHFAD
jgi:parvulin-like peptidyl-prolyl isomerase